MLIKLLSLIFFNLAQSAPTLSVSAYNSTHFLLSTQLWSNFTKVQDANYYRIGSSNNVLRVWQPFEDMGSRDLPVTRTLLGIGHDLILANLGAGDSQTVSVEVKNAGWGGVSGDDICIEGADACADIVLLGTTQIAGRVAAGDFLPLNSYFGQYAARSGKAFSETFLPKYFFDYYYDQGWMGIPFVTDVRVDLF